MSDRLTALLAGYQRTAEVQKTLVDVRFKLLALVPTITAIGVGLLKDHPSDPLAIGIFGLVISLVVTMYEIRNSQIHDLDPTAEPDQVQLVPLGGENTAPRQRASRQNDHNPAVDAMLRSGRDDPRLGHRSE
jgi:hypothetical protein